MHGKFFQKQIFPLSFIRGCMRSGYIPEFSFIAYNFLYFHHNYLSSKHTGVLDRIFLIRKPNDQHQGTGGIQHDIHISVEYDIAIKMML